MQPDQLRVALRLREPWEAVDWGFCMVRGWWRPLVAVWLALIVPISVAAFLLTPDPGWAVLLLWWLKPAFDRVLLHVLSKGVFGPLPSWTDTLAALPQLLVRSGILYSLLALRLSPQRSLVLPVLQLEGLRGRGYANRARVVGGRDSATAMGLTLVCLAMELAVLIGASALIANLVAQPADPQSASDLAEWLGLSEVAVWQLPLYAVAIALVEPFYVAGGFGLYLNRRIELEGWDIEVQFRSIARRHPPRAGVLGLLLLLGAAAALALVPAGSALADPPTPPLVCDARAADPGTAPAAARPCIERVLATPEFRTKWTQNVWRPREWLRELFSGSADPSEPAAGLAQLAELLAAVFRALTLIAVVVVVVALIAWLVRELLGRARAPLGAEPALELTRGRELASQEAADDPIARALERFASDPTAALALLYAAARSFAIAQLGMVVPEGATERECERECTRRAAAAGRSDVGSDFAALTRAWVYCAYGHRVPNAAAFRELCERWRAHRSSP